MASSDIISLFHLGFQTKTTLILEIPSISEIAWPSAEQTYLCEEEIIIPVQINGKKKATLSLSLNDDASTVEKAALLNINVQKAIAGKKVKNIIVVPGKIVNVVV